MGNNLLVAPSGNLYYCTYSATPLGHIADFPNSFKKDSFGDILSRSFIGNFPECKGCDIEGHCLGGCLLTREGDKINRRRSIKCAIFIILLLPNSSFLMQMSKGGDEL